jgi:transposase
VLPITRTLVTQTYPRCKDQVLGRNGFGEVARLRRRGRLLLEIVKRSDDATGFVVLPRRWVVERTFAWLGRWRRLSKDYEATIASSEAMVKLAAIHMMVRRLARKVAC